MASISHEQCKQVLDLHAQGLPRNDTARQTGVSADSVTNMHGLAGLTIDR